MEALKDGDLQTFTDVLNTQEVERQLEDPGSWLYSGGKEDEGFSLAELCIELEKKTFLSTLVRLGVQMDLLNPLTGYSAVHRAAERGKPHLLEIILKTENKSFDVNTRAAKRMRGLTPLHLAASTTSDGHLKCLSLLLDQPFIQVDIKDSSLAVTPLFAAAKARNVEAVEMLIEQGADPGLRVKNKTVRDHLQGWIPSLDLNKIKVKKIVETDSSAKEKMIEIARVTRLDDTNYTQNLLRFEQICRNVPSTGEGFEDVVELVSRNGLSDFAQLLYKRGADPNKFPENSTSSPIIDAAERGDAAMLMILKKFDGDFTKCKEQTQETVLHSVLKNGDSEGYRRCLNIILSDNNTEEFKSAVKKIINRQDLNGNTALHYSTQQWPTAVTRSLLQHGANIGIKNDWGEIPISRISTDTLEDFLNEDCMTSNGEDVNHSKLEITFRYDFLAPDPASLPDCFKPHVELEECQSLANNEKVERSGVQQRALPETESLFYMGQSKQHRHLLKHPVVTSFLWFKWERIRPYFNRNFRLYSLFVFMLTWFIFVRFGGSSQQSNIQRCFYGLYVVMFSLLAIMIIRDWCRDVGDAIRAEKLAASHHNNIRTELNLNSPKLIWQLLLSNWLDLIMILGCAIIFFVEHHQLHVPVWALLVVIGVRELLQLAVSIKRYVTSVENLLEVTMMALVVFILLNDTEDWLLLNRHLAAIAIVLSWGELITLIGRHPKLLHCNVYVTMFYRVLNSFFFFLLWYSLFIIAFGLGFYIMLHNDDSGLTLNKLSAEDQNPLFNRTWLSLVKTSAMFVGELEFSDLPINPATYDGMLAYVFFLAFIFLVTVVLMNLLNGLAVNDTSDIKQKAEIYSYISRVETISYMESVLLGDPFNFLSNVPDYLSNIPSCSILRQFYRSEILTKIFSKLGASRFLLFYTFLPEKRITVKPNQPGQCCLLTGDEMGREIVLAAKLILSQQTRREREHGQILELSREIDKIKQELACLGDISSKIDLLLKRK